MACSLKGHICRYVYSAEGQEKALCPQGHRTHLEDQGVVTYESLDDGRGEDIGEDREYGYDDGPYLTCKDCSFPYSLIFSCSPVIGADRLEALSETQKG